MYKGFDLQLVRSDSMGFMSVSNQDINNYSEALQCIRSGLLSLVDSKIELTDENNQIDVNKLKNDWFPIDDYDVFISHSHKDEIIAKRLACWLKNKFHINSFIDSAVWGYSNDLLKHIDDNYCVLSKDKSSGKITYDYNKRNYSTSQVNLILSSALHDMIDHCECIIFLNTENSINISNTVEQKTSSPWLYDELQTMKLIKIKNPTRTIESRESNPTYFNSSTPDFQHDVTSELNVLSKITQENLVGWGKSWDSIPHEDTYSPLDLLYSEYSS